MRAAEGQRALAVMQAEAAGAVRIANRLAFLLPLEIITQSMRQQAAWRVQMAAMLGFQQQERC